MNIYYQPKTLSIRIDDGDENLFEIDLVKCSDASRLLEYLFHIRGKAWRRDLPMSEIVYLVMEELDRACLEVFGHLAKSVYMRSKVEWKRPGRRRRTASCLKMRASGPKGI